MFTHDAKLPWAYLERDEMGKMVGGRRYARPFLLQANIRNLYRSSAEVTVSEEQLEDMIKGSVELGKWSAQELRMRELTEALKDDNANPGRIELGQT
jgi:hypothetical protein